MPMQRSCHVPLAEIRDILRPAWGEAGNNFRASYHLRQKRPGLLPAFFVVIGINSEFGFQRYAKGAWLTQEGDVRLV